MEPYLLSALAFLGGASLGPLLRALREGHGNYGEHPPQRLRRGFSDLLLWGVPLGEGATSLLLNRDGSLTAAWRLEGPDHTATTEEDLVQLGRTLHDSLLPLQDHYLINFDASRIPAGGYAPPGEFPDPLTASIDAERRRSFDSRAHFLTETILCITYRPPADVYRRAANLFVEEHNPVVTTTWTEQLVTYGKTLDEVEARLRRAFHLERLDTDGLASHLRSCVTGEPQALKVPSEIEVALTYYLVEDLIGGFKPQIGNRHLRVVHVRGFPQALGLDAFEPFHKIPFPCRSSHRLHLLSRSVGRRIVNRQREVWWKKYTGLTGTPSSNTEVARKVWMSGTAADMAIDTAEAIDALASGETLFGSYVWNLIVTDPELAEVERKAEYLRDLFSTRGFAASLESINALPAYLGSLPAHGRHNLRRPLLSLKNLAHLLPTTTPWLGELHCPSSLLPPKSPPVLWALTEATTPYRFHLHHQDVAHGLILGRTGGGKSVFLALLALQALRWPGSRVYIFDVDYSAAFPVLAAGGDHYQITPDAEGIHFQPLARIDDAQERAWAAEYVETLLRLQQTPTDPQASVKIQRALELLSELPPGERTLTGLTTYLDSPKLREALRVYLRDGRYGVLLDADAENLATQRLQAFEVGSLMQASQQILLPVLLYLFHRIETSLDTRQSAPTLILIEEAWLPLLHPTWSAQIRSWLRRLRKKNAGVWLVTQSPHEVLSDDNRKLFLDSLPSRVFLPDANATEQKNAALYQEFGLNPAELALLSAAEPRHHYLHKTPRGSRLIELGLGPLALAALTPPPGATVYQQYRQALALRRDYSDDWFPVYLESLGEPKLARKIRDAASCGQAGDHP